VAKWLFAVAVILLTFARGAELKSGSNEGPSLFLYLHCAILFICLFVAALVKYFQSKYRTETKRDFYQAVNCALWWTGTGVLYFFIFYLFTIAGFVFLIFAFFLWLEAIRQAYHLRQTSSHTTG
jgi:uncharacterized membrane protein